MEVERKKKANRKQMKRRILKPVVGHDEFYPKSLYPNLLNLWMRENSHGHEYLQS